MSPGAWLETSLMPSRFQDFAQLSAPYEGIHVRVEASYLGANVTYRGTPEALIACGVATPEELGPVRPGTTRFNRFGERLLLYRRKGRDWIEISWQPTAEQLLKLPGVPVLLGDALTDVLMELRPGAVLIEPAEARIH